MHSLCDDEGDFAASWHDCLQGGAQALLFLASSLVLYVHWPDGKAPFRGIKLCRRELLWQLANIAYSLLIATILGELSLTASNYLEDDKHQFLNPLEL